MSSQDNRDNSSMNSGAVNRRHILLASTSVAVASALGSTALMQITRAQAQTATGGAETTITEQEAHAIGVDAYLYFYPLVTMDLTRKQLTNVEPGKGFGGPMNTFAKPQRIQLRRIEPSFGPTSTPSIRRGFLI